MQSSRVFTDEHQDRFDRIHRMAGVGNSLQREEMWFLVKAAYAEPHRNYHTANHIIECLEHYDAHTDSFGLSLLDLPQFISMELAIWWHDVVYHVKHPTTAISNEALSAACLYTVLKRSGVSDIIANGAHDLILATDHQRVSNHELAPWIVDVDMAVLGADKERFAMYELGVEIEYTNEFQYEDYLQGRLHFLRTLLEKEHLYQTDAFRAKYEDHARNNIQRLIKRLEELVQEGES